MALPSTASPTGTILVCDDERGLRQGVLAVLREEGHDALGAGTLREACRILKEVHPDVLLLDLRLPDGDGLDILGDLPRLAPGCLALIVTAHASVSSAVSALRLGAFDYLEKPLSFDDLLAKVATLLRHRALLRENAVLRREVARERPGDTYFGDSDLMRRLLQEVELAGRRAPRILITGETGVGKEMVARRIHDRGSNDGGTFVAVNMAALPESMVEAQLFGHVRGAFTGAEEAAEGLVRAAAGGTLFLDEIAETPPLIQVKLLRLIDHGEVLAVGSSRPLRVRFRLVAATNRDPEEEVEAGRLRADLFHRLDLVRLHIPPLRERPEDIPGLAAALLHQLAQQQGLPAPDLAPAALDALSSYAWPGNVRELRNVIERILILGPGCGEQAIGLSDLPGSIRGAQGGRWAHDGRRSHAHPAPEAPSAGSATAASSLREAARAFERRHIEQALRRAGGNRRKAAALLGISLATLYRKLEEG